VSPGCRSRVLRHTVVAVAGAGLLAVALLVSYHRSVPDSTGGIYGRKDYRLLLRFIGRDVVQATVSGLRSLCNAVGTGPKRVRERHRPRRQTNCQSMIMTKTARRNATDSCPRLPDFGQNPF